MRKERFVTITDEGRDKGKVFHILEMSSYDGETFSMKLLQAIARAGEGINMSETGIAGVAALGQEALGTRTIARIPFDELRTLLDDAMKNITIVRDPAHPEGRYPLREEDIEEVATRMKLRNEVLDLQGLFSDAGSPSTVNSISAPPASKAPSRNIRTSRPR